MTLKFYGHPLSSFCWKVLIALYERDVAFDYAVLDPNNPDVGAEFQRLWPVGKMPLLADGEGFALAESSLIVEQLDHLKPGPVPFVPTDWERAREVRFWDRFFDLYVQVPMQKLVFEAMKPADAKDPMGADQARQTLRTAYAHAEAKLAGRTWAAGEAFSMADCAAAPALHYGNKVITFAASHPHLAGYLRRLQARPSFARVLKEAEPYAHMFPLAQQAPEPA